MRFDFGGSADSESGLRCHTRREVGPVRHPSNRWLLQVQRFCLPFQHKNAPIKGKFVANTKLRAIMALYYFDTDLRALCGQALEKIEIYIRNIICDHEPELRPALVHRQR
ncbi:Abi family protein [Paraburkholderia sp. 40]|uniref:Abi family protein n=1 Tax=unclassified Paraburkholderia TaxID=2615204 RepID=UPI003D1AB172